MSVEQNGPAGKIREVTYHIDPEPKSIPVVNREKVKAEAPYAYKSTKEARAGVTPGGDGEARKAADRSDPEEPAGSSVADIMDWVDGNPDRAVEARDKENQRSHPRSSLLKQLDEIIGE